MLKSILLIGVGGGIGSIARFLLSGYVQKLLPTTLPIGTFATNMVGCLLAGILSGLFYRETMLDEALKKLFIIGFCGGFTTFSSFAMENFTLLHSNQTISSILYALGSIVLGIIAVEIGFLMVSSR